MARVKFNFGKMVGLSVLVIALAVGVALTQENQDFREKAYNPRKLPNITSSPSPKSTGKAIIRPVVNPTATPMRDADPVRPPNY